MSSLEVQWDANWDTTIITKLITLFENNKKVEIKTPNPNTYRRRYK